MKPTVSVRLPIRHPCAMAVESAAARRRFLAPLALAQFICSFAGSNMNVMINDITEDLDTTVTGVQATITLFLLVMAVLMIPCSKLTDRWGRKRCFTMGLVLYGIGATWNFNRNFGVRAEWERLNDSDIDILSIGLQYRF